MGEVLDRESYERYRHKEAKMPARSLARAVSKVACGEGVVMKMAHASVNLQHDLQRRRPIPPTEQKQRCGRQARPGCRAILSLFHFASPSAFHVSSTFRERDIVPLDLFTARLYWKGHGLRGRCRCRTGTRTANKTLSRVISSTPAPRLPPVRSTADFAVMTMPTLRPQR